MGVWQVGQIAEGLAWGLRHEHITFTQMILEPQLECTFWSDASLAQSDSIIHDDQNEPKYVGVAIAVTCEPRRVLKGCSDIYA